ncbi:uncharacterized protein F5Z01DRAFT_533049 [Emericellopsis atlantica]|uniref:RING-type domain-containing protein n=1 Tax=Emericellopsis atlantica TaxID=2614577 RepID=A0A9P7ZQU7_9HYPO|nr:uncharacterized protein F5Z01DRAFT_533049 [Emericellopsis atlantica]KAG9256010.1 hypothetical protein F5Z01DRAFT_533049 [Emericellopsis atlantica]
MPAVQDYVGDAIWLVARATADAATSSTTQLTGETGQPQDDDRGNRDKNSSSPLLFFVALGFGVVFTNLWIIVGVKYCFRYNARNRAIRNGEDPDQINMENMPNRPHRRRREKKLMTIDEVNEKFPLTKYKAWVSERAREGLPTAGGVDVSASRANSLRDAEGILPAMSDDRTSFDRHSQTNATTNADTTAPDQLHTANDDENEKRDATGAATEPAPGETSRRSEADNNRPELQRITSTGDDDDEDDHIDAALPPEALQVPGDSCAICIEPLEDDEDIRGLTCGHAFHAGCVDPWLTSRRACCPLCKADYYTPKPRPANAPNENANGALNFDARHNSRLNLPSRLRNVFGARNNTPADATAATAGQEGSQQGSQQGTLSRLAGRRQRRRRENASTDAAPEAQADAATGAAMTNAGNSQTPEVVETRNAGLLSGMRSALRRGQRRDHQASGQSAGTSEESAANVTPSQLESGIRPNNPST